MSEDRLELIASDLSAQLRRADHGRRRDATVAAAHPAYSSLAFQNALLEIVLCFLDPILDVAPTANCKVYVRVTVAVHGR